MATQSRLTVFDTERAATLGLKDGAIYPLPPCDLPYGELEATTEPVTEPPPLALDRDVRAAVGFVDDGATHEGHVSTALAAAYTLRKASPRETPLGKFYRVQEAHEESVIDLLRAWGVSYLTISNYLKRDVDSSIKRLIVPGSLAKAADELEANTRKALEADKARAKVQSEYDARVEANSVCPPDRYYVITPLPTDRRPDRADYVDNDDNQWFSHELPAGLSCDLKSKPDRLIVRPGEPLPLPNAAKRAVPAECTYETYQALRKATRTVRRGQPQRARPDSPSLRYRDQGREIIAAHLRHISLSFNTLYGHKLEYVIECLIRGLGLPVNVVIDDLAEAVTRTAQGAYFFSKDTAAEMAVRSYESIEPEAMPWLCLAPVGVVDRVSEKAASWAMALRRIFMGKDRVSSPEAVSALVEAGETVSETDPGDQRAIYRAMTDAGYRKTRIQTEGQRQHFFVKQ